MLAADVKSGLCLWLATDFLTFGDLGDVHAACEPDLSDECKGKALLLDEALKSNKVPEDGRVEPESSRLPAIPSGAAAVQEPESSRLSAIPSGATAVLETESPRLSAIPSGATAVL
jgi:hypothetical protein